MFQPIRCVGGEGSISVDESLFESSFTHCHGCLSSFKLVAAPMMDDTNQQDVHVSYQDHSHPSFQTPEATPGQLCYGTAYYDNGEPNWYVSGNQTLG